MAKMIFVNLPVADVAASTAFYEAIGFVRNAAFSDDRASAMGWSDTISVMLLDHGFYRTFTDKEIADAKATSGVLLCLSFDGKERVDAFHRAAIGAGGRETRGIADRGFMYGGACEDPDGHVWETLWMDPAARPAEASA